MYSRFVGPIDIAIRATCKNCTFSELYEMAALSSLLKCNIRSVYPNIDMREDMTILNNIFMPAPPSTAHSSITVLWSHMLNEMDARTESNGTWSPNHFVPLLSLHGNHDSNDTSRHIAGSNVVVSVELRSQCV